MQLCLRRWIAVHARVNGDVKRGAFPLAALGILCGAAHAGDLPEQHRIPSPSTTVERHSGWETQVSLYGWTPALAGKVGIRNLPSTAIDMPISDVLSDLDGAVMASVFANNDRWLLLADLVFARLSDTAVAAGRTVDATITQTIATGAVGAMLPTGNPQFDFAVTGGLRYVSLNGNLSLGSAPGFPLSRPERGNGGSIPPSASSPTTHSPMDGSSTQSQISAASERDQSCRALAMAALAICGIQIYRRLSDIATSTRTTVAPE